MSIPAATESRLATSLRHGFRMYRESPLSLGHPLLRRLFRALLRRHQVITLHNGIRLQVDLDRVVQHTIFWLDGDMEPQLEWVIRELLPVGGTCVDCGANCGLIGLLARRLRGARVLFLEPHPRLAEDVRRNIGLNHWEETCTLVEAAASDAEGEATLFESVDYDGSHSLLADWVADNQKHPQIKVPLTTLKSILQKHPEFDRVDLLKVDTEGHDLAVLRGLNDWLEPRRIPVIYAELGRDRDESFQLLERAGYTGFSYQQLRRKPMRRLMKRYGSGEPVAVFQPLRRTADYAGESLWVGTGSRHAAFLAALADDPSAQPR
jgi:FkbM family methyltransferase